MQTWAAQDAKARFSQLLRACDLNGPQLVTRRGVGTAVLVPYAALLVPMLWVGMHKIQARV